MATAYCIVYSLDSNKNPQFIIGQKNVVGHKQRGRTDPTTFYIWSNAAQACFPGGKIANNEPPAKVALREYKEETGFDLETRLRQIGVAIPNATQFTDADGEVFYCLFIKIAAWNEFYTIYTQSKPLLNVDDDELSGVHKLLKSNAAAWFGPTVALDFPKGGFPILRSFETGGRAPAIQKQIRDLLPPFNGKTIPQSEQCPA